MGVGFEMTFHYLRYAGNSLSQYSSSVCARYLWWFSVIPAYRIVFAMRLNIMDDYFCSSRILISVIIAILGADSTKVKELNSFVLV